jgi:hydroxypyruvate reductase
MGVFSSCRFLLSPHTADAQVESRIVPSDEFEKRMGGNVLNETDLGRIARSIFAQTLTDCSIDKGFAQKIKTANNGRGRGSLGFGDHLIDFGRIRHIRIVAVGKASGPMLNAFLGLISSMSNFDMKGVVVGAQELALPHDFSFFRGGHPFPNEASFAGAAAVLNMLDELPSDASAENTLCVFLVSGGASAMLDLPLDSAISLEDTVAFHRALVHSGASIMEINCVRKHFSAVKGGRLAQAARPATCLTILLSDVPPGRTDTIGSGPTVPDSTTIKECREILERHRLLQQFPDPVRSFFASEAMPETVKSLDSNSFTWTVLSADDLADSAKRAALALGFHAVIDNTCDDWDYRDAAAYLLERLRALRQEHRRVCLISAGEITVRLTEQQNEDAFSMNGKGGRNQHFALYAATNLQDQDAPLAILSAGSDGIDGHSDAAGAVVDALTLRPNRMGIDTQNHLRAAAEQALQQFDSSTFLETLNATIFTGPTGNNLRDLRILLAEAQTETRTDPAKNSDSSASSSLL